MDAEQDLQAKLAARNAECKRLQERVAELEDALQSCLSRARYCSGCGFAEWWQDATELLKKDPKPEDAS